MLRRAPERAGPAGRIRCREGITRLGLMATLPGVPLCRAYGFEPLEEVEITMPDGVTLPSR